MRYLKVTENGCARILFSKTDKSIAGLAIDNLETCTGIVIVGEKGMSVIHDESFLDLESINQEFVSVGTLKQWFIVYNPSRLKGDELTHREEQMQPLLKKYGDTYKRGASHLFSATATGKLLITRENPTKVEVTVPEEKEKLIDPLKIAQRKAIRHLNNLYGYKSKKQRIVPIDVQYDGNKQTDPTAAIVDNEQAKLLVNTVVASWGDKLTYREYSEYVSLLPSSTIESSDEKKSPKSTLFESAKTEKITKKSKFDELEELKKSAKSSDEKIMLQLTKLALKAAKEVASLSEDYDTADYCCSYAREHLKKLSKSKNATIKKEATDLQEAYSDQLRTSKSTSSLEN